MMKHVQRALVLFVSVALSGCGGAGGGGSVTPNAPNKEANASATFVIKIPAKASAAASKRIPHYVTSNVKGIDFTVQAVGQQPIFGASSYVFYPLVPQASYCSSSSSGLTCSVQVNAPPGNDVFTTNLYDGTITGLSNIIATGTLTQSVSAGVANAITITTNGQPNYIIAGSTNPYPASGAAATIPLSAQVADADGDIIIGSFDLPVNAINSDTSGATTLSKTTFTQNSDFAGLSLAYTGGAVSGGAAMITFNGNYPYIGGTQTSPIGSVTITPGSLGPVTNAPYLYFANASSAAQTITASGGTSPYTAAVGTCGGFVTISGTSPTFTVTPTASSAVLTPYPAVNAGSAVCSINVSDAASRVTYVELLVGN